MRAPWMILGAFNNILTIFCLNILKKNHSYDINLNRNIIHVER